jgi:hypothetical protein
MIPTVLFSVFWQSVISPYVDVKWQIFALIKCLGVAISRAFLVDGLWWWLLFEQGLFHHTIDARKQEVRAIYLDFS